MKSYHIGVSTAYVNLLGDISAGYVLAECIHWTRHYSNNNRTERFNIPRQIANDPGWFYKTESDWQEIGVTARVWRRVKKQLEELGLLECQFIGTPARIWMRIDFARLHEMLKDSGEFDFTGEVGQNVKASDLVGQKVTPALSKRQTPSYNTTNTTTNTEYPLTPRGGNQTATPLVDDLNPEEPKKRKTPAAKLELPPWLSRESWEDFVEHRKALRKPMTPKAGELILKKLQAIAAEHGEQAAQESLLNSIAAGWQGVFPPKDTAPTAPTSTGSFVPVNDKNHNLINSWLEEDNGNETNDRQSAANMGSQHRTSDSDRSAGSLAADLPGSSGRAVCGGAEKTPARDAGAAVSDSWADLGLATKPATEHGVFFSN